MNKTIRFCVALFIAFGTVVGGQTGDRVWNFDRDAAGKPPEGFTSATAPSQPNVLAQTSQDKTDYRFPLAIAEGTSYKDPALSVKFKAISGKMDQGAGLVFRLKDKDNYYIVRANALENNFRLYHVVNGRRIQFAGANFKVTSQEWHEIKVEARGDEFKCYYDTQLKFTAKDSTFKDAGKVGLWTKADSVIYFDDLTAKELGGSASGSSADRIMTTTHALAATDKLLSARPPFSGHAEVSYPFTRFSEQVFRDIDAHS